MMGTEHHKPAAGREKFIEIEIEQLIVVSQPSRLPYEPPGATRGMGAVLGKRAHSLY